MVAGQDAQIAGGYGLCDEYGKFTDDVMIVEYLRSGADNVMREDSPKRKRLQASVCGYKKSATLILFVRVAQRFDFLVGKTGCLDDLLYWKIHCQKVLCNGNRFFSLSDFSAYLFSGFPSLLLAWAVFP